jgi:hypothetical protein
MPSSDTHVSRSRVFPAVCSPPSSSALSIIDSSVSNYTTCGALFVFPAPTSPSTQIYSLDVLTRSLELVLTRYPQLCGTLRLEEYDPVLAKNDHTKRFGRVELLWGGEHDRGLDLIFATRPGAVSSILPRQVGTGAGTETGAHDVSSADRDLFVSRDAIVRLRGPDEGRGAIGVKVTTFSQGGIAIAVGMHHTLGDAQALSSSSVTGRWSTDRFSQVTNRHWITSLFDLSSHSDSTGTQLGTWTRPRRTAQYGMRPSEYPRSGWTSGTRTRVSPR